MTRIQAGGTEPTTLEAVGAAYSGALDEARVTSDFMLRWRERTLTRHVAELDPASFVGQTLRAALNATSDELRRRRGQA